MCCVVCNRATSRIWQQRAPPLPPHSAHTLPTPCTTAPTTLPAPCVPAYQGLYINVLKALSPKRVFFYEKSKTFLRVVLFCNEATSRIWQHRAPPLPPLTPFTTLSAPCVAAPTHSAHHAPLPTALRSPYALHRAPSHTTERHSRTRSPCSQHRAPPLPPHAARHALHTVRRRSTTPHSARHAPHTVRSDISTLIYQRSKGSLPQESLFY